MHKTQLFESMRNVFGDTLKSNVNSVKEVHKQLILFEVQQNKTRKTNQNKTLEYLKLYFFFSFSKWKYFILEVLCELFKWKVVPFQFFPWTTKVFFLFLLFCLLHFLCHRRMQKKNKEWKQWKKNGGKYRCLKVSSKISNFTVILNIKLENYSVWSNNVRFLFKVRLCCHWSC